MTKKDIYKMAELTNNEILYEDSCTIELETSGDETIIFEFNSKGILEKIIA